MGAKRPLQAGDQLRGFWAKRIAIPASAAGAFTATIPAGLFRALPVVGHSVEVPAGTSAPRDYVLRLAPLVLNADKTITVSGLIRQSRMLPGTLLLSGGNETFEAVAVALVLHLTALEASP